MNLKEELISCSDGTCTCVDHYDLIECFHKSIIDICIFSANQSIPFSKPIRKQKSNTIPNWNSAVAPFRETALFWHEYCIRGRPSTGFYFEMRKLLYCYILVLPCYLIVFYVMHIYLLVFA